MAIHLQLLKVGSKNPVCLLNQLAAELLYIKALQMRRSSVSSQLNGIAEPICLKALLRIFLIQVQATETVAKNTLRMAA